jgi:hypothetical protein
MPSLSTALGVLGVVASAAIVAVEPALAGGEGVPVPVPAPLVGAGIPALIAFAGGYWAIRRRRR